MRSFRITLALVMLFVSVLWLVLGTSAPVYAFISEQSQIIPSAIQACLGVTVAWIIATILFGRIYCAVVCPLGTLQDVMVWTRRKIGKGKEFRFEEGKMIRYIVLLAYLASLAAGIFVVGYVIEPWNIMRNVGSAVRPADTSMTWEAAGISIGIGILAGAVALSVILIWAWKSGRQFCTTICPIGTALGCLHSQTLMHIAIDPDKCIGCMKCEDVCEAHCIKVTERRVDNSRCVRCFDCTDICPNGAIRFQLNKDRRRQTPLMEPNS